MADPKFTQEQLQEQIEAAKQEQAEALQAEKEKAEALEEEQKKWQAEKKTLEDSYKKMKDSFDKVSSDIAKYKKEAMEKLTDEERVQEELAEKQREFQELLDKQETRAKELAKELAKAKVDKAFAKSGFKEEEYQKITEVLIEISDDHEKLEDISNLLSALVKQREEDAVALARTADLKDLEDKGKGEDGDEPPEPQVKLPKVNLKEPITFD